MKILQGQANIVTLTLTEEVTLSSPVFLFEFIYKQTKEKFYCIAADTSSYTYRYNKFTITESSTAAPLTGTVTLSKAGFYTYNVYEQTSSSNLVPTNANKLLETGKCKVYMAKAAAKSFSGTNTGKTFRP